MDSHTTKTMNKVGASVSSDRHYRNCSFPKLCPKSRRKFMGGCGVVDDRRNSLTVAARTEETSSADVNTNGAENAAVARRDLAVRQDADGRREWWVYGRRLPAHCGMSAPTLGGTRSQSSVDRIGSGSVKGYE